MAKKNRAELRQELNDMIAGQDSMSIMEKLLQMDDSDAEAMLSVFGEMVEEEDGQEEPDPLEGVDLNDKHALFRRRLTIESFAAEPDVMDDLYGRDCQKELEIVKTVEMDEQEYQVWKKHFLDTKYEQEKDQNFRKCFYVFAGTGEYTKSVPENQVECLRDWVNANGSAFFDRTEEATEEDVKIAIGKICELEFRAGDDL